MLAEVGQRSTQQFGGATVDAQLDPFALVHRLRNLLRAAN
jgi:hypothetical protein